LNKLVAQQTLMSQRRHHTDSTVKWEGAMGNNMYRLQTRRVKILYQSKQNVGITSKWIKNRANF